MDFVEAGMTGVAAQMCGTPEYKHKVQIESEMKGVVWGARKAILSDLSPIATFLASNYTAPLSQKEYEDAANQIIEECEKNVHGWRKQNM